MVMNHINQERNCPKGGQISKKGNKEGVRSKALSRGTSAPPPKWNPVNVVHYLNYLHVIHLSKQIFKASATGIQISEDLLHVLSNYLCMHAKINLVTKGTFLPI